LDDLSQLKMTDQSKQDTQDTEQTPEINLAPGPTAPLRIAGRYEVVTTLTGGMGIVYLCRDHVTNQAVALKTFKPEYLSHRLARDLFLREGTMWVELGSHPHIVRAHRVERIGDGREVYLVLEWVVEPKGKGGPSLRSWLFPGKPLTIEESLLISLQVARGMKYAVSKIPRLVHRDLKPENILIGFDKIAKVTDFGLASTISGVSEQLGVNSPAGENRQRTQVTQGVVGTPLYMPPEQWQHETLDERADIYALGCILYEMLTGHVAAEGETQDELRQVHLSGRIKPPPPSMPKEVITILQSMLAPEPERRFRNWRNVEGALVGAYTAVTGKEAPVAQIITDVTREDRIAAGESYNMMGLSYLDIGKLSVAVMYFEQAVNVARAEESAELEGVSLGNLGLAYVAMGYVDRALEFFDEHLSVAHKLGDQTEECRALGNLGRAYRRMGKQEEAIRLHERELAIARKLNDQFKEAVALYSLGETYLENGDVPHAVTLFKKSLTLARENGDRARVRSVLNGMGRVYLDSNDIKEAAALFRQSLEIAREMGDRIGEGVALGSLGDLYRQTGKPDRAIELYDIALTISQESNDHRRELSNLNRLGDIYFELKKFGDARDHYEAALTIAQEVGDKISEMKSFETVADAYQMLGDYMHAASLYRRMNALAQDMKDEDAEQRALYKLGIAYESWGDLRRTINYFKQHLAISQEKEDDAAELKMLIRLGDLLDRTKQLKPAIKMFELYLAKAREMELPAAIGRGLNRLGDMSRLRLELEQAVDLYKEALDLAQAQEDTTAELTALANLGVAYTDQGKKWQAIRNADKALALARSTKSGKNLAWTYYKYALILFKQEKWVKVFPYAEKAADLFERLGNEEMLEKSEALRKEAETEQRKKRSSGFLF
jgi:tetratricopeptide (TPR) repeat protein